MSATFSEDSRGLDQNGINFLASLLHTENVAELKGCVFAVDMHYLTARVLPHFVHPFKSVAHSTLAAPVHEEHLLTVTGGESATLLPALRKELLRFEHFGMKKPILVFPGLPPRSGSSNGIQSLVRFDIFASTARQREISWWNIEDGVQLNADHHSAFAGIPHPNLLKEQGMNYIFSALKEEGYECIRAPYSSVAQIAYLFKAELIHQAFAPPELILYEKAPRVIIEFLSQNQFCFLDRNAAYESLCGFFPAPPDTYMQQSLYIKFLNTMLVCSAIQPYLTAAKDPVRETYQMLQESQDSVVDVLSRRFRSVERTKLYQRTFALFRHGLVLNQYGCCVPISEREKEHDSIIKIPCNLSDLYGYRIPDTLYFLHSIGFIGSTLLTDVTHHCLRDHTPLVDTVEYREMLERVVPLRTQILYQMIHAIDPAGKFLPHRRSPLPWHRWFHHCETTVLWPPHITLGEWNIVHHQGPINFSVIYEYFHSSCKELNRPYECIKDAMVAVHMKTLDLLGYFTHSVVVHTLEEGCGFSVYSEALRAVSVQWLETAIIFIELMRTKSLRGGDAYMAIPHHSTTSPVPHLPIRTVSSNPVYNFIARLWCLVPMETTPNSPWLYGASRDLSAFLTIVGSIQRTLRSLSEALFSSLLLRRHVLVDVSKESHLFDVSNLLPFRKEYRAHMGLVAQYMLSPQCEDTQLSVRLLQHQFPTAVNLTQDLLRAFHFWSELSNLVNLLDMHEKELHGMSVTCAELLPLFRHADVILQRKRAYLFPVS